MKIDNSYLCTAKQEEMTIVFSQMKGGVGKSTLCILLANYLAAQGYQVRVYDVDAQRSLSDARKEDMANEPDIGPRFDIVTMEILSFIQKLPLIITQDGFNLIDLPGSYSKESIRVLPLADLVLVPFQYEEYCLQATARFGTQLDLIAERHNAHYEVIYVPNRVEPCVGTKAERDHWELWAEAIRKVAILAPGIHKRASLQRRSTLYLRPEEEAMVKPCFDFILERIDQMLPDKGGPPKPESVIEPA